MSQCSITPGCDLRGLDFYHHERIEYYTFDEFQSIAVIPFNAQVVPFLASRRTFRSTMSFHIIKHLVSLISGYDKLSQVGLAHFLLQAHNDLSEKRNLETTIWMMRMLTTNGLLSLPGLFNGQNQKICRIFEKKDVMSLH